MSKLPRSNNLGWKIVSLVFAIGLWLFVINSEDPIRTQTFNNVPITVRNESVITNKNKYINYPLEMNVDVTIEARRSIVDNLKKNEIVVVADVNRYQELTGTIPLDIFTEKDKDISSTTIKPTSIKVNIEDIVTKAFEVKANIYGELKENYVVDTPRIEPNSVEVTGPESRINQIDQVYVDVDMTDKDTNQSLSRDINIVNSKGKKVTQVTSSMSQVTVTVDVLKIKKIPLRVTTVGTPAPDYKYLDDLTVDPQNILVKGPEEIVNAITELELPPVDINGLRVSKKQFIKVADNLPEQVTALEDQPKNIAVDITIHPLKTKTMEIPINQVKIYNLTDTLNLQIEQTDNLILSFKGLETDLSNKLNLSRVIVSIDAKDIAVGSFELPIKVYTPNGIDLVTQGVKLPVTVSQLEDATATPEGEDIAVNTGDEEVVNTESVEEPETEAIASNEEE